MSTSNQSTSDAAEGNVDSGELSQYLTHLHEHISHVQHHVVGHDTSHPMLPSFYPPRSHWTSAEKDRFFHALTVHSRFRPDLVAEHIGTKTLADVCLYLDVLDEAIHNPDTVSSTTGLKFVPPQRDSFPAAHEVSDEWLEYEDGLAAALAASEPTLVLEQIERAKEDEIHEQRKSLRAKKGAAKSIHHRDREGEKARNAQLQEWVEKRKSEWAIDEVLRSLGDGQIRAIDAILREDEESWATPTESTQGSKRGGDKSGVPHVDHVSPPAPDNDFEEADDTGKVVGQEGELLTEAAVAGLPTEEAPLSPTSRRRLRKRLYMRRKRAEKTGQAADQSVTRLKPGRKGKSRGVDVGQEYSDEGNSDDDTLAKQPQRTSGETLRYRIREQLDSLGIDAARLRQDGFGLFHATVLLGLMRTYNGLHDVPDDVTSRISANTIQQLRTLLVDFTSQLVRQSIVSREQEITSKALTKAWRLTESPIITRSNVEHALLLLSEKTFDRREHFAKLLKRLNLEEEEEDGDEEAVADTDEPPQSADGLVGEDGALETDENSDADITSRLRSLPLNRIVFPPYIRLPISSTPRDPNTPHPYLPWRIDSFASAEEDGEDVLSSDTDDEVLESELADEEDLDEQDRTQQDSYEKRLWFTFKPPPEEAELVVDHAGQKRKRGGDDDNAKPKRKYRPRVNKTAGEAKGAVKSAPYIEDSDIDL